MKNDAGPFEFVVLNILLKEYWIQNSLKYIWIWYIYCVIINLDYRYYVIQLQYYVMVWKNRWHRFF